MKIHVLLTGRLGNQLFQYIFAKSLQLQYGGDIVFNLFELEHRTEKMKHVPGKFKYELGNIVHDEVLFEDKKPEWFWDIDNYFEKFLRKLNPKRHFSQLARKGIILWLSNEYIEIPNLSRFDDVYIVGWWQNVKWFEKTKNDIISSISFSNLQLENCADETFIDAIKNKESVCISVRGGNYLHPKVKKKLFVCDRDYFCDAIKKIKEFIKSPVFVVFSDDLKWVKNELRFEESFPNDVFVYETGTNSVEEKLLMMSSCSHFVISNSTFSWWAQFLSSNPDKYVMAPNKWTTNGNKIGIYMENWCLIDTK